MAATKLAIIILNYNGWELTAHCVRSLLQSVWRDFNIFILDNGSRDDEAHKLQQEFGNRVIAKRSPKNLGFSGGNNFMLQRLMPREYEYFLLLNQDTLVTKDTLGFLVAFLSRHPKVAVIGPQVLRPDGSTESYGATISLWTGKVTSKKKCDPQIQNYNDVVLGNCFMVRKQALQEVGLFDEKYFAYYEEVDWVLRAKRLGWQNAIVPAAQITHLKTGGFRTYLVTRNMIWFEKKHASLPQLIVFFIYFWLYFMPMRLKKGSPLLELFKATRDGWFTQKV